MNNQNFSYPEYPQKDYSEKLTSITQLLKESWRIYCLKIKTLLGITGLPVGFSFLFWVLMYFLAGTSLRYSIWFSIIGAIFYLGSLFLWLWAAPSLIYTLKENSGIKESYKRGFKVLGSYIWVYFLSVIIIAGGFLLFIIPGVLFSIWFSLAIFVLVFEERKGFKALFRSKHLVKGKFWGVLLRFLVLGLIIGLVLFAAFALIIFAAENKQIGTQMSEVIGCFIQLFALPFFLIYEFLIYNNLKEIKTGIPYEESAPSKKIKYVIPGILGALIVGLIIAFSLLNIFWGRDIPPIDDSDLWLSKIEIPREENAFYYLAPYLSQVERKIILEYWPEEKERLQKGKEIYWPEEKVELIDKIIEGKGWNKEFVKDLIENNEQVFNDFEKAIKCPYFQDPITSNLEKISISAPVLGLRNVKSIAELNLVKSIYLFNQGREKESLDQVIKVIKFGQMLEDSPRPILIDYLLGMTIKEMGLQQLRIMIPRLALSPEVLKDYIVELEQFKANEEGLVKIIKMEYISFANTKSKIIDAVFTGKLSEEKLKKFGIEESSFETRRTTKLNYFYKPNQTQKIFAEHFRHILDNTYKNYCNEVKSLKYESLAPKSKIKMLFTENLAGKILHDIVAVNFSGLFDKKCLEDFSVTGTQLLTAIKAYQIETGKMPAYLSDLVPEYFSEVPKDPFDGKLVKYSPEKKIIYSVGRDLKDSGGSEGEDWRTMEDPTFKIEF